MADISNVNLNDIKEISDALESLQCKLLRIIKLNVSFHGLTLPARILTRILY
jgi:hypothetical protein